MRLFVTGGAGYIGSHCVLDLLKAGHEVTSFDNYSNSSPLSLSRAAELAGVTRLEFEKWIEPELQLMAGCVDRLLSTTGVSTRGKRWL